MVTVTIDGGVRDRARAAEIGERLKVSLPFGARVRITPTLVKVDMSAVRWYPETNAAPGRGSEEALPEGTS